MTIAYLAGKKDALTDARVRMLFNSLEGAGHRLYPICRDSVLDEGTDLLLGIGGDGTFLNCVKPAVSAGVPVLGVNLGRLGFLSENSPEDVSSAVVNGSYRIEEREMLHLESDSPEMAGIWPYALNEITVHRAGSGMLGVDAELDGATLPTYWADGLLVATSSGSTAYSLSAGGPICTPDVRAHIIAPIAPHNLNMRPLVVSDCAPVRLRLHSRDGRAMVTLDNNHVIVPDGAEMTVTSAPFTLKRVTLRRSSFISVLRSRLFWGEDVRNHR